MNQVNDMHQTAEEALPYIMLARYYGSELPRFMSVDPIGGRIRDPLSFNRYSYVRNNPINLHDPSGMIWVPGTGSDPNPPKPGDPHPGIPCYYCKVEYEGDPDKVKEVDEQIEARAAADPEGFGTKWKKMKDHKKKTLVIKVEENVSDVNVDLIDQQNSTRKRTVIRIDIADIGKVVDKSGEWDAKYRMTADEQIAHAVIDAISFAFNGGNYGLAHEEGLGYQNNVMRLPAGREYIDSISSQEGSNIIMIRYRDTTSGGINLR